LFEVCQGLKGLAGELACERISDQELAALSKMHIARAQHYHDRDLQLYYLCNR
jgi:DNA-binding GntR family transcriptional regulator